MERVQACVAASQIINKASVACAEDCNQAGWQKLYSVSRYLQTAQVDALAAYLGE